MLEYSNNQLQAFHEVKLAYLAQHNPIGKIRAVKLVRAIGNIGLREAKEIVDGWGPRPEVYYIHKGIVTDFEAYDDPNLKLGQTEWQLSDSPTNRTTSYDFLCLEEALSSYPNAKFYWVGSASTTSLDDEYPMCEDCNQRIGRDSCGCPSPS